MFIRIGETLPRSDIKFQRVPRAHHNLAVELPYFFPTRFRAGDHCAAHHAETDGPILMKAIVRQRINFAMHIKDADLALPNLHNNMCPFRHISDIGDDKFRHATGTSSLSSRAAFSPISLRRTSSETGICKTLVGWSKS